MLLKNKDLFFFLIIIFLVIFASVARAQDICDIGNIKKVLRKVLYFYFINPQDSPLSLNELKDLLVFYLGIKEQVGQVDCSVTGSISNSSISSIIDSGWNVTDTIPTCADGTKYGECSTFKPKYCYTGSLLHRCDYCGCPSPSQCSTSGKCGNATCSSDLDCGESGFVRFNHCLDGKLYRNYDNITCLNSQCSNETVTVLIDDCKSKGEGCEWNQTIINYVCQGKMTNETCVDYDGGDNLLMASYAKKGTQMQYDKCGTAGQNYEIIEGVCQNNEVRGVPHSCPTGTECKDIRFEPAVNAYVSACVNATSGNLSAVEWPSNIKPAFSYGAEPSMWGKIGQQVSFDYKDISTLKSLRLYEKKPNEYNNSFNLVSEFTNLASVGCDKDVLSGNWKLTGDCNSFYAGKTWHAQRINPPSLNIDLKSASFYNIGEYRYYVTAVDASNNYKSSAIGSMHFLNPLTILSPTSSQSPIPKLNFTWTSISGWPVGAKPYTIQIAEVNSSVKWSKSGISSSPVIYDGAALDPSKKYLAHVYGSWHNSNQSESYTSIDSSTTTFWVSNAASQTLNETFKIVQITISIASQANSDIYSNIIVWQDGSRIYMYDISTGQETKITSNTADQWEPDIYGNRIVYRTSETVYMYDLSTKQETQITTNTASGARIYEDKVVWHDRRQGLNNKDIYMYDLSTKQETQITTNPSNQLYPDIYASKIVYYDDRNGNYDIYMYDLLNNKETQITTNPSNQDIPVIYDNIIVWRDFRNGNYDIYMYDISTGQEMQISINTADQWWPAIYDSKVVWDDYRNSNWDIY